MYTTMKKTGAFLLALMLLLGVCTLAPKPAKAVEVGVKGFTITRTEDGKDPQLGISGTKGDGDYFYDSRTLSINSATPITIQNTDSTNATDSCIEVSDGVAANITLNSVNIVINNTYPAFTLGLGASATITLVGGNVLTSLGACAGMLVPENTTLEITSSSADGSLTVTGGAGSNDGGGAGIGGNGGGNSGNISITGKATVITTGGLGNNSGGGAGIGGGGGGSSGNPGGSAGTIYIGPNATVTATGGNGGGAGAGGAGAGGAGIGGGGGGSDDNGNAGAGGGAGNILIHQDAYTNVTATGGSGAKNLDGGPIGGGTGAGIGGGGAGKGFGGEINPDKLKGEDRFTLVTGLMQGADSDSGYTLDFLPLTLVDTQAGITVNGNGIASNSRLTVQPNKLHAAGACKACDEIRKRNALAVYDISLTQGHTGSVEVFIPFSGSTGTYTVLHCNNGTLEEQSTPYQNGGVTTTWKKLSPFAVVQGANVNVPENVVVNPPKTGSDGYGMSGVALVLCALVAGVVARKRSKGN